MKKNKRKRPDDGENWAPIKKSLHSMFCKDPDCPVSFCKKVEKFNRASEMVQWVNSASNVRRYAESKKALEEPVLCVCPTCREHVFPTVGQMMKWERQGKEPVAVACSLDCANRFTAELAKGLPD
jgi:hypothetical protein